MFRSPGTLPEILDARCAPLGRSIPDQEHNALKVIGMTPRTDPFCVELAFADQTGIFLDIEVERKWDRDYRNGAHGLSHCGYVINYTSFSSPELTAPRHRRQGADFGEDLFQCRDHVFAAILEPLIRRRAIARSAETS